MDFSKITKIIYENYDKGILGGLSIWAAKKVYRFAEPRYKKLREYSKSVDRIGQLRVDVDFAKEEHFILRETFKGIVKTANYPMYMLDSKRGLILVNTPWLAITGFSNPEDAYATGYFKAVHEDDEEELHDIVRDSSNAGFTVFGIVRFKNLISQTVTECSYRTEPIKTSKGETINYIGSLSILSITPKK